MEQRRVSPRSDAPSGETPDTETQLDPGETPLPQPREEVQPWQALGRTHVVSSAGASPAAAALPPSPAPQDKATAVLGDFRLLTKLGEGAMGAVYRAYQISFQREVALKVLFKHVANNAKLVERLYREGLAMGQLDHPNIVAGYGVGEVQGWHYIAMEFVDGKSLQRWLNRLQRLSVGDALHITLTCARALQYAHDNSLIHRDIKPDNILITRHGRIKIADLGMVKRADEDMSLTQTGHAVGTPWYMPLEQAKNAKEVDARSDIYALGCMLYCQLTGSPPFAGPTLLDVIQAKEQGTFPPARSLNREVPERLDLIIAKMTSKLPRYRYQSCAELIPDLQGLGLANASLSFVAPAALAAPAAGQRPEASRAVQAKDAPQTTQPPPVPQASEAAKASEMKASEGLWYLRFKNAAGQVVVRRLSTAQVLQLLGDDTFDPAAMASRQPTEDFRPLASWREFVPALLRRAAKPKEPRETVAPDTGRFRTLYEKIEAKEQAREKKHQRRSTNFHYWSEIILRVAVVVVILSLIVFVFSWLTGNFGQ